MSVWKMLHEPLLYFKIFKPQKNENKNLPSRKYRYTVDTPDSTSTEMTWELTSRNRN